MVHGCEFVRRETARFEPLHTKIWRVQADLFCLFRGKRTIKISALLLAEDCSEYR